MLFTQVVAAQLLACRAEAVDLRLQLTHARGGGGAGRGSGLLGSSELCLRRLELVSSRGQIVLKDLSVRFMQAQRRNHIPFLVTLLHSDHVV